MKTNTQKVEVSKATVKWLLVSPSKAKLVASLVRGKTVSAALVQLQFCQKKTAEFALDAVKSALANAGKGADPDELYVDIHVGSAGMWKRMKPRAFGRASMRMRRRSHIWVRLLKNEEVVSAS